MKRFRNVLVVYDDAVGGDDALGQGAALARENGAQLTIATVLREGRLGHESVDETRKRLQRLAESVVHTGVAEVATRVLAGTPYFQIVRQVLAAGHDLVVTSEQAGNSLRERVLGGTATQLMRKCPCPVWVVKPGQTVPYGRILAAVDLAVDGADGGLAQSIVDLAVSLAARDRAVLHVLHAWEVDGKDLDTVRSEIDDAQRLGICERHRRRRAAEIDGLLARHSLAGVEHHVHLPREPAARAIRALADAERIDLIVMGMHARQRMVPFLDGNTAEAVLATVGCGVLTVKPAGYVTPVSLAGYPQERGAEAVAADATKTQGGQRRATAVH